MMSTYHVHCECGSVQIELSGSPKARGFCHREDCRTLLNVPYHSKCAWESVALKVKKGSQSIVEYQHPHLNMKRAFCSDCGEALYNTNAMDWRVVSQLLLRKCYDQTLPEALSPLSHFFYDRRIVDVEDGLPKRP